ncbi:ATP-binding protein [Streptomyces sp. Z26]|uniref:ATP-binding protein n=1 Tax=Streptomyces TaxID=1883 RepID=UPI001F0BD3BC|nr:ATP-binding protein [Streptomyces sp. Z26]
MISRTSTPSRHCAVEFQALPWRIAQVRRIMSAQLRYWRLDPLVDPVALGLTELLANVHEHAGPDKHCTVELVFLWDRLTVSVRDRDPSLPTLRPAGVLATGGRGLALVAAVSASWGVHAREDGGGKLVWFTLDAPFTRARTDARPVAAPPPAVAPPTASAHAAAPPVTAAAPVGRRQPAPHA